MKYQSLDQLREKYGDTTIAKTYGELSIPDLMLIHEAARVDYRRKKSVRAHLGWICRNSDSAMMCMQKMIIIEQILREKGTSLSEQLFER